MGNESFKISLALHDDEMLPIGMTVVTHVKKEHSLEKYLAEMYVIVLFLFTSVIDLFTISMFEFHQVHIDVFRVFIQHLSIYDLQKVGGTSDYCKAIIKNEGCDCFKRVISCFSIWIVL